jgi:hypothetical protein
MEWKIDPQQQEELSLDTVFLECLFPRVSL